MLDVFKKIWYKLLSAFRRGRRPAGENTVNIPEPVYVRDLFDGKVTFIVFGAPFNWNYAGASREEMEAKNPGITTMLEEVMREYGIKRALVPKPAFNAKVVTAVDLQNELLPNFFRGANADGVILEKSGDAYFLASADCLAVALFDPLMNTLAALHCGRDAVIDRKRLDSNGADCREYESVIHAATQMIHQINAEAPMEFFLKRPIGPQAFLAAGIRPETFTHPTHEVGHSNVYAYANRTMIGHLLDTCPVAVTDAINGNIDLFALVRHQLKAQHIVEIEEDEFDTATSKGPDGEFLFHSNRRDRNKRNLVVIKLN